MKSKVQYAIDKYNMLENGDKVIVALSGGADSVCLLHIFVSLREKYNLTICAAHLNHMIRGEEAKRDMDFVKQLCKSLGVKLFCKEQNIEQMAKDLKQSLELCGRNARYEFFSDLANSENAKIATAHTASDNLETMIYNISRGTSINGLKGIVPKRNYIIRPLIFVTRQQIEEYCKNNKLCYVNDSTNSSDLYTRNKIRHQVVPVLKNINPLVESSVSDLSCEAFEINNFLEEYANNALKEIKTTFKGKTYYDTSKLRSLPPIIQKQSVAVIFKTAGVKDFSRKHINICCDIINNGGEIDLNSDYKAVSSQNLFRVVKKQTENELELQVQFLKDCNFSFCDKKYSVSEISLEEIKSEEFDACLAQLVDISYAEENATFRLRQEGDFLVLPKRNITKTLKKFLNEEKIPKEERDKMVVLAVDSEILWLEGFGTTKSGMIKQNSNKALKITVL